MKTFLSICMSVIGVVVLADLVISPSQEFYVPGTPPSSTLNTDLVAYWKLDETSGTRIDSEPTGTAQDLSDTNTVGYASGIIGNAGDFEASSSEYLVITDSADLSTGATSFTIAGWLKLESGLVNRTIVARFGTSAATREYIVRINGGTTQLDFLLQENGGSLKTVTSSSFGAFSINTWYFFLAQYDLSAQTISVEINNSTTNTTTGVLAPADVTTPTYVGGRDSLSESHDGLLDEIGFWKRTLTESEKSELYNSGSGKTCCPF